MTDRQQQMLSIDQAVDDDITAPVQEQLIEIGRLRSAGDLLGLLAHELNQPLTAISNYAHGCWNRVRNGQIAHGELEVVLDTIGGLARRAADIIDRLRSDVGRKDSQRSSISLNELVLRAKRRIQPEIYHANVELVVEQPPDLLPNLWVDIPQIEQVLVEVLRNAVESIVSPIDKHRRVTLMAHKLLGTLIEVEIRDHGTGILADDFERVFQPFVSTKLHRLGMGLPISRSIIELHGGQIWIKNESEGGSCVRFTLPTV